MNTVIRLPLNEIQSALYNYLSAKGAPVHDNLSSLSPQTFPRVEFGEQTGEAVSTKVESQHSLAFLLHVYSKKKGKKELNDYMSAISTLIFIGLQTKEIVLENNFELLDIGVDYYESFLVEDEDADFDSYHGVIRVAALVQDLGAKTLDLPWKIK